MPNKTLKNKKRLNRKTIGGARNDILLNSTNSQLQNKLNKMKLKDEIKQIKEMMDNFKNREEKFGKIQISTTTTNEVLSHLQSEKNQLRIDYSEVSIKIKEILSIIDPVYSEMKDFINNDDYIKYYNRK